MKLSRKVFVLVIALVCFAFLFTACGKTTTSESGNNQTTTPQTQATAETTKPPPKVELVIMIAATDDKAMEEIVKKTIAKFPDYNITSKPWETANAEKIIKTTIAAGDPIDIAMYWPNQMETFVNANMALDLTPYLDENGGEWKNTFVDKALEIGTYNGKTYAVPYASVYPLIEANKDILDQAGVTIPDGPLAWDDFIKICDTIKEKTGIYPIALNKDWASWAIRNTLLTVWPDKAGMDDFAAGKIPFTDPLVVKAFDAAKELYDNHMYPGKGAITTTLDAINVAFKSGKVAMKMGVNVLSAKSIKESGLKNVQVVSWPHLGTLDYLLGGCNGYMIPAGTAFPKEAVEVMKYLTSAEILQLQVDNGVPVTVKGVKSDDPNFMLYSKDSQKVYPKEIINLSSEISDYIVNKMPANYIFNGLSSLEELEKLRLEATKGK